MDSRDWDARYAAADLVWGAEPNRFVAAELAARTSKGRALDLGCGEGRNAIWLTEQGWSVTAVDFSEVAVERAKKLAKDRGANVSWLCADLATYEPPLAAFELVLVAYLHVPHVQLRAILARAAAALAPAGELLMIGHARRNLAEGTGGPRDPDVLWAPEEIEAALRMHGLSVERCVHVQRPVETPNGPREAIDLLVRAHRPA